MGQGLKWCGATDLKSSKCSEERICQQIKSARGAKKASSFLRSFWWSWLWGIQEKKCFGGRGRKDFVAKNEKALADGKEKALIAKRKKEKALLVKKEIKRL